MAILTLGNNNSVFSGSFQGDGSALTGVGGDAFPFTGDAQITGSLTISGSLQLDYNGEGNIIIGSGSGGSLITGGTNNIIFGNAAATSLTTGDNNLILGTEAGNSTNLNNESQNTIIGNLAGKDATYGGNFDGGDNTFVGYQTGRNSAAQYCTFVGSGVGIGVTKYSVGMGANGTLSCNAEHSTAIGYNTQIGGVNNYNVSLGTSALRSSNGGSVNEYNVALGYQAQFTSYRNNNTISIGAKAAYGASYTQEDIFIGYESAYSYGGNTTGRNLVIGYQAGYDLGDASTNNILIGEGVGAENVVLEKQLKIGSGSTTLISGSLADGGLLIRGQVSASSYIGDGSGLSGVSGFPFTGDAQITGSLTISGSGGAKFIVDDALNIHTGVFYGLGRGVVALNNTNHTNILIGNDISSRGDYGNVVIGASAGANNSSHSQIVIGRSAQSYAISTVAIGTFAKVQSNNHGGISIGNNAGNISNSRGINIGLDAKGLGEKGIVLNSSGLIASPTKANTFGVYMTNTSPNFEIEATGSSKLSGSSFTIEKSGSTVFEVIGSEGTLFSVSDNLTTGSLFAVKDLSGIPLLDVTANSTIPDVVTVGQSNLLVDSGSLEVVGSISASGDVTGRLQRPTQEFGTNFTASADYSGYYLRTGGNVTCSIQANALPSINSEFDFFQTSSAGNMLFETGSTSVILNSKNNNLNLAGQFSSATLKYVGNNTFDLMGDLT